jgi:hypothetical protein
MSSMARDPLLVLHAMRRRAVEQARYALGSCLQAEADVANRARLLDETMRRDREAGGAWQDAHQFLEMAAIRSDQVRAERQIVAAEMVKVSIRSGEARNVVTAARTAAEAVEQLIGERTAATRATAATREQHVMDDIARLRRVMDIARLRRVMDDTARLRRVEDDTARLRRVMDIARLRRVTDDTARLRRDGSAVSAGGAAVSAGTAIAGAAGGIAVTDAAAPGTEPPAGRTPTKPE